MIVLNIFFAMLYFMLNVYYIDTTEQFLFKSLRQIQNLSRYFYRATFIVLLYNGKIRES